MIHYRNGFSHQQAGKKRGIEPSQANKQTAVKTVLFFCVPADKPYFCFFSE